MLVYRILTSFALVHSRFHMFVINEQEHDLFFLLIDSRGSKRKRSINWKGGSKNCE